MESTTNNILVPLDFSEQSLVGLGQSYNLAKLANAEITLLHVIRDNNSIWNLFTVKEQEDTITKLENKLKEFAEVISERKDIKINTIISKGSPVDQILKTAADINAKFIVMGTTSADNISKKILGTYATRVIREAKCPVLTVKGKHHRDGCDNIILPLDLTKETREKISKAIYLAKYFGSSVHAISVMTTDDEKTKDLLYLQLEQVQKFISKQGIECTTKLLFSSNNIEKIVEALIDYANKANGDLITIMTQQETEFKEFFIGSLAKQIIHKSDIPVMSIAPK